MIPPGTQHRFLPAGHSSCINWMKVISLRNSSPSSVSPVDRLMDATCVIPCLLVWSETKRRPGRPGSLDPPLPRTTKTATVGRCILNLRFLHAVAESPAECSALTASLSCRMAFISLCEINPRLAEKSAAVCLPEQCFKATVAIQIH